MFLMKEWDIHDVGRLMYIPTSNFFAEIVLIIRKVYGSAFPCKGHIHTSGYMGLA